MLHKWLDGKLQVGVHPRAEPGEQGGGLGAAVGLVEVREHQAGVPRGHEHGVAEQGLGGQIGGPPHARPVRTWQHSTALGPKAGEQCTYKLKSPRDCTAL